MKNRGLIAAAAVLAVLAGALYWSNRQKPAEDAKKTAADAPATILALPKDNISSVEIKRKSGEDIVLSRSGPESWSVTSAQDPQKLVADSDQVSSVLGAIAPLTSDRIIEDQNTDRKQFGLSEPLLLVVATPKDGKARTLLFGDDSPTGNSTYAMLEGDAHVYTVPTSVKTSLDKGFGDLRDKRLLPVDFENLTRVTVTSPKLHLAFASEGGRWVIKDPKDVRGDTSKMEALVEKLKVASIDSKKSADDTKKALAAFAAGTPAGSIQVTDASGSQQLELRKNKDEFYAKTTAMNGVYKMAKELGQAGEKSLDDFREKNLLDFGADNPEKIELHDGTKAYYLTRSGEDWWSDGKKMDYVSVDSLIRAIRLLSAGQFVAGGYSEPALSLVVTSMDGKRVEKVSLSKKDSAHYVARRDGEPTLYGLSLKQVEDVQKSAADIKPAEAPKK